MSINYDLNADFCQWVPGDPFHAVTSVKYFMHMRVKVIPLKVGDRVIAKVYPVKKGILFLRYDYPYKVM